jgi:DNA-binding MarR family transcriptional regulator/proteasome lid subunit RPN8/RPN11
VIKLQRSSTKQETDLKFRTSTLLYSLVQRRASRAIPMPLDEGLLTLLSGKSEMPKFPPKVVDRVLLSVLGFNEIQTDSLLVLWEAGGELEIWGDGSQPDLCHELDLTSSTVRHHLKPLEAMGLVSIQAKNRAEWVKVVSPLQFGKRIVCSMRASARGLDSFFQVKQEEFKREKQREDKFFVPVSITVSQRLFDNLQSLATKRNKIVYGVVTAIIEDDGFSLQSFHEVGCRSGEKTHFVPNWKQFHAIKRKLMEQNKSPIIEFHSHPSGSTEPTDKDLEKMKMLRRGYWVIAGKDNVIFLYFYHKTKQSSKNPKIELHVEKTQICPK